MLREEKAEGLGSVFTLFTVQNWDRELCCFINHLVVFLWLWTMGDGRKNSV